MLRKFVDTLPGLGVANNIGNLIPLAHPDTLTYPGSDYYEISLRLYTHRFHSDLPPTNVRGYVQTNNGTSFSSGVAANDVPPEPQNWLGPVIIAVKDRPIRIKFKNELPAGAAGDLLIPVDESIQGSGKGAKWADPARAAESLRPDPPGHQPARPGLRPLPADPRRPPPARRPHPVDQRRHAAPVDPAARRLPEPAQPLQAGRQPLQRARHAGSGPRRDHVLLVEPAERAPHVLP